MISSPIGFTENIPMSPVPYIYIYNPIARGSLRELSEVLYVKQKSTAHRLGVYKSKLKAIRVKNVLRSSIKKRKIHTKKLNG